MPNLLIYGPEQTQDSLSPDQLLALFTEHGLEADLVTWQEYSAEGFDASAYDNKCYYGYPFATFYAEDMVEQWREFLPRNVATKDLLVVSPFLHRFDNMLMLDYFKLGLNSVVVRHCAAIMHIQVDYAQHDNNGIIPNYNNVNGVLDFAWDYHVNHQQAVPEPQRQPLQNMQIESRRLLGYCGYLTNAAGTDLDARIVTVDANTNRVTRVDLREFMPRPKVAFKPA